jgi:hypothetical protein
MNAKRFFIVLMPVCNGAAFLPDGQTADLFLAEAGMGGPLSVRRLLKTAFRAGPHRRGTWKMRGAIHFASDPWMWNGDGNQRKREQP